MTHSLASCSPELRCQVESEEMVFLVAWTRVQKTGVLGAFVELRVTHAVSELINISN